MPRRSLLIFCRFVCLFLVIFGISQSDAVAEENVIDFESLSPQLPGWSATAMSENNQPEYRVASKWDAPFSFSLDGENPHSGSVSLKLEASADVPGRVTFGPTAIPASGPEVEFSFFVRCDGLSEEGMVSLTEYDSGGARLATHWAAMKIPISSDWTEVTWSGKVQPGTSALRVGFLYKWLPAGAKVWIDDIAVKSVAGN